MSTCLCKASPVTCSRSHVSIADCQVDDCHFTDPFCVYSSSVKEIRLKPPVVTFVVWVFCPSWFSRLITVPLTWPNCSSNLESFFLPTFIMVEWLILFYFLIFSSTMNALAVSAAWYWVDDPSVQLQSMHSRRCPPVPYAMSQWLLETPCKGQHLGALDLTWPCLSAELLSPLLLLQSWTCWGKELFCLLSSMAHPLN